MHRFGVQPTAVTDPALSAATPPPARRIGESLLSGRSGGLLVAIAVLFTALVIKSPSFLTVYTMSVLSRQLAFFVLIALAQAVCLVVRGMNLSVGAMGGFCTVILGVSFQQLGLPAWISVGIVVLVGSVAGLLNGLLITRLKLDSFIVTLSMMFVFMGLRSGISGGSPYRIPEAFMVLGQGAIFGVPYLFWIMVAVLLYLAFLFRATVLGRHLLATGGNLEAARLSGVHTDRMILLANVLSGLLAGLTAVLWASKLGSAAPETGDNWLVASFAVAIIGGTSLNGGSFSSVGIFLGGMIFVLVRYSLVEMRANDYYANAFLGGLILLTVAVDRMPELLSRRRTS